MRTREVLAGLCAALATALAAPARADDKQRCISAYESAQELRRDGKLRAARDKLLLCGGTSCPDVARKDCVRWLDEVRGSLATVVIEARDERGRELVDVRVRVDGDSLAERLDGRAVEVDPGVHTFRYEVARAAPVEERVTVREGEKNRRIIVALPGPTPPARRKGEVEGRVAALALGGAGVLALGSFAYFGVTAITHERDLRDTCARPCPEDRIAPVRRRQLAADVSLGVGVASLAVATWLALRDDGAESEQTRAAAAPVPGGGMAFVQGAF